MTDDQRFRLDAELREKYDKAKADLSREKQRAHDYGESLRNLGAGLENNPQTISVWRDEKKEEWCWTFSQNGQHLAQRGLPEWSNVREITHEIGRLGAEVERLAREMRERGLS